MTLLHLHRLASNGSMNWKDCGRKQSWLVLTYYPSIFLKGLKKTRKFSEYNVSWPRLKLRTSWIRSRDANHDIANRGKNGGYTWFMWLRIESNDGLFFKHGNVPLGSIKRENCLILWATFKLKKKSHTQSCCICTHCNWVSGKRSVTWRRVRRRLFFP